MNEYNYTVYNRYTGAYVKNLDMPDKVNAKLNITSSEILVDGGYEPDTYYKAKEVHECPEKPDPAMVWDNRKGGWYDPRTKKDLEEEQERLIRENRGYRNKLLDDTDKMVVPDRPMKPEVREQWLQYRQKLRDIADFVNPEWPVAPTE